VADDSVNSGTNFVAGGNKPDTHFKNVNYPRDSEQTSWPILRWPKLVTIALNARRNLWRLEASKSGISSFWAFVQRQTGRELHRCGGSISPDCDGVLRLGLSRLLAAAIEQHHDDKGIIWPMPIAPYQVYLCPFTATALKSGRLP